MAEACRVGRYFDTALANRLVEEAGLCEQLATTAHVLLIRYFATVGYNEEAARNVCFDFVRHARTAKLW